MIIDRSRVIPDDGMLTWESQVSQYPARGVPGISYFRGYDSTHPERHHVDCLLFRGPDGKLQGVLNYYAVDMPPWEKAGNMNMWVRPDKRRRGIGTRLLDEARRRWPFNLAQQRFSESGVHFMESYLEGRPEAANPPADVSTADDAARMGVMETVQVIPRPVFDSPQRAALMVEEAVARWDTEQHQGYLAGIVQSLIKTESPMIGDLVTLNSVGLYMRSAALYAVMEEPLALIRHAAATMALQAVVPEDLPAPSGLALFQQPLYTLDAHGDVVKLIAVQWMPGHIVRGDEAKSRPYGFVPPEDANGLAVAWYSDLADLPADRRWLKDVLPGLSLLHFTAIPYGESPDQSQGNAWDIWRIFQAFMAFVKQEVVVAQPQAQPREIRRRAQRAGKPEPPPLHLVRLRRVAQHAVEKSDRPGQVEWHHRWVVRGHWRLQPYPKYGEHRQIWIYPFMKGPADKPILERRTVFNVSR